MTDQPHVDEPEAEQSYVDAIMDREAELAQRRPPTAGKPSRLPILIGLVVVLTPLLVWNAYRLIATPEPFTSGEEEAAALVSIYLTAHELQLHKDSSGVFPATLTELALDDDHLQYMEAGDGYVLTATWDDGEVTFRSGEDLTRFADALDVFVVGGGIMSNVRGFTIIELLIVMTIIGIVASIAIPSSIDARRRATAQRIIGDFTVIRQAAYDQFADNDSYPRNGRWGQVPPRFVPSLPEGFQFSASGVTYRWRRWGTATGLARNARARAIIGLQIRSNDRALIASIRRAFGGTVWGNARNINLAIE